MSMWMRLRDLYVEIREGSRSVGGQCYRGRRASGERSIGERFVAKVALIPVSASVGREAKGRELISFLVRACIAKSSARLPA